MKFKRLASAVLAVVMVGVNIFGGILPVMAAGEGTDDPTIQNPDPVTLDDGIVLSKTVRSVPGYANKWEITLRIESPKSEKTSDTVIVIDRSGSMGNDNRLTNAKAAARSLAQQLLSEGNTTNRVAVVSFAGQASNSGTGTDFTDDYETVSGAIGRMSASGGTYTQGAIHMAAEMLSTSTADIKTMILLSDGEPTYSTPFTRSARDDNSNFVAYGNALETSSGVDQSVFNYTDTGRVGNGSNLRQCMEYDGWDCAKYYNNGNSAIAEASYYKNAGGTIYTIALDAGDVGTPILNAIASPDKHYTATPSELTTIFNEIGGNILSLIQSASVEDTMGHGVTVSGTDGETSLEWEPEFTLQGDVFVAETTYEVEMNEEVYNQTATGGFYSLNESAILTYNDGQTGEFPIPKAKPFDLDVEKVLTIDGEETIGEEFKFTISGNGETKEYTVKSGEEHVIPVPMPIKLGEEYTVTETGVGEDNDIAFEYYDAPEYTVKYNGTESATNKFVVTAEHGDVVDIVIKNNYETAKIKASKVWEDDEDRDGLREDYDDLYAVVKDGSKYVAMEKIEGEDKSYTFDEYSLPKNRNGSPIDYVVIEATGCEDEDGVITCDDEFANGGSMNDGEYVVTIEKDSTTGEFTITNEHTPETTVLEIKKKWDVSAGTLPTVTPGFVTVEISNDKNDTKETVTLKKKDGDADYVEWTGTFEGYAYENGKEINYTVKEKEIGTGGVLNSDNTLYVYENGVLEGKWVATHNGTEVTNTWTPAKPVYTGSGKFYIEKLGLDDGPLAGVTFTVGGEEYTTGTDGKVEIEFSESDEEPEDSYTFEIEETNAPSYYEIIDGTEVLEVTTNLDLTTDEESLTNTYEKTFTFAVKTAVDGYVWQNDNLTLLVTDQALIDELKIEKTFDGISETAFEEKSQINFTIEGPDGFTEMTVGISDDECEISDSKLTCTIDGADVMLPVGEYTVTENDAEIENFTFESNPTSGKVTQTVGLGEIAEFEFENKYESVKTASYAVKKIWEDDDDRDGARPDSLKVTLYADDEVYDSSVELAADYDWSYEWEELPLVNENAEEIEYSVQEEDVEGYDSDGGEMKDGVFTFTNTHDPETKKIVIKKTWDVSQGDLPTSNPAFIMVELSNDKDDEKQTIRLDGSGYGEWESDEITVLVYANQGERITYRAKEIGIDSEEANLIGDNKDTLYIYNGEVLEGKWVAGADGELSVTNTWTPAKPTYKYDGDDAFKILKIDEEGDTMSGVVFLVNGEEMTTDGNGEIEVEVSIEENEIEEELEFEISEKEAPYGYDQVEGSATVTVTCVNTFDGADEENLINKYVKTCEFGLAEDSDEGFAWDGDALTLTVTNMRSLASSLTIEKTVSGVNAEILEDVTFTIEGPEDFGEEGTMTLTVGEDCEISEDKITCEVDAEIPTGDYTVTESNADIEHFTLHVSGDNGEEGTKTVGKDDDVVFEINNEYVVDMTEYRVVKVWYDEHDKDGIRPGSLTVELSANGEVIDSVDLSADYETEEDWGEDLESSDVWECTFELPYADKNAEEIEYYAEELLETDEYEQIDEIAGRNTVIFVNMHEPAIDPCADGEGCGGGDELLIPETGRITGAGAGATGAAGIIGGVMIMILAGISLVVKDRNN